MGDEQTRKTMTSNGASLDGAAYSGASERAADRKTEAHVDTTKDAVPRVFRLKPHARDNALHKNDRAPHVIHVFPNGVEVWSYGAS